MAEWERFMAFDHLPVGAAGANAAAGEGALTSVSGAFIEVVSGRRWCRCSSSDFTDSAVPSLTNMVVGFRGLAYTSSVGGNFLQFRTAAGAAILQLLSVTSGRGVEVRQGSTVLGRSTRTMAAECYLETQLKLVGPGADSVVLRIDGTDELTITGLSLGSAPIEIVRVGSSIYHTDAYYREAPAEGSPFRGPIFMRWLPVKDDVSVQWARNGGASNASRLIDPNGSDFDATYVESQTLGEIDEYTLEQLPAGVNSIIAVVPTSVSIAPSGGAPQIRRSLKTGAGTAHGPERTVGVGGWRTQMHAAMEKPGSGGWSRAAVGELRYLRESV